jgi:hypothetical protein
MRLLDNLRNAEQKSVNVVSRGITRAREEWGDLERRIRQRMRVYPQKLKKRVLASRVETDLQPDVPAQGIAGSAGLSMEPEGRKPIISVHGRDIEEEEIEKPAA